MIEAGRRQRGGGVLAQHLDADRGQGVVGAVLGQQRLEIAVVHQGMGGVAAPRICAFGLPVPFIVADQVRRLQGEKRLVVDRMGDFGRRIVGASAGIQGLVHELGQRQLLRRLQAVDLIAPDRHLQGVMEADLAPAQFLARIVVQLQDPPVLLHIGDGVADPLGDALVRQVIAGGQQLQALGGFDVVEVFALQVLDQRGLHAVGGVVFAAGQHGDRLGVVGAPDAAFDQQAPGAPAALAHHQLIEAVVAQPDDRRLQHAMAGQGVGQGAQRLGIERLAGVVRVRDDPRVRQARGVGHRRRCLRRRGFDRLGLGDDFGFTCSGH